MIKTLTTKSELKAEQGRIVKLRMHVLSYFLEKFFLVMLIFKTCLVIKQHLVCQILKNKGSDYVIGWKSKVCLNLNIFHYMMLST